jgi:hypothetical protein
MDTNISSNISKIPGGYMYLKICPVDIRISRNARRIPFS